MADKDLCIMCDYFQRKIYNAKMELRTARGFCHRRDLKKHIHRLEKDFEAHKLKHKMGIAAE